MEKKNNNGVIIGLLIGIIIMLLVFVCLFATNTISFSNKTEDNNQQANEYNDAEEKNKNSNNQALIEVKLPSNEKITISKEYEKIFNNNEKIIVKTDNYGSHFGDIKISNNSELTLSECLEKILDEYPDDFYTEKGITISNSLFDFDNDGVNEVMFSMCETYLLLHYYNNKVYGYVLNGYRTNGNWMVDGSATGSSSAFDGGRHRYSFDGEKIISNGIYGTSRDDSNSTSEEVKMIYYVNEKVVSKEEYDKFVEEYSKIELINFIKYSENE